MKKETMAFSVASLLFLAGCENVPPGVVDDTLTTRVVEFHVPGESSAFRALMTSETSDPLFVSWRKMRSLIESGEGRSPLFLGYKRMAVEGFGASVELVPLSYAKDYAWVVICNDTQVELPRGECRIKGEFHGWVAEVLIARDEMRSFDLIVAGIQRGILSQR